MVWARSVHSRFVSLENVGFFPSFSVEIRDVPIGLCGRSAGCDGRKCSDKCRRFGFRLAALQCSHSFKTNLAEEEHEEPVTIILDSEADAPAFPITWASAGVMTKQEHWEETTKQGSLRTYEGANLPEGASQYIDWHLTAQFVLWEAHGG